MSSPKTAGRNVYLVANGDLRPAANRQCWPAQHEMEQQLETALRNAGSRLQRAHAFDPEKGHGFIDSQKMGIGVFREIPADAPLIVAEAVWQYTQHLLPGLLTHRGPILTVANWSGTWPGLVGLLNLNASLTKAGVAYSTLWSETFRDPFFKRGLHQWLETGTLQHDLSHVQDFTRLSIPETDRQLGLEFARAFRTRKAIMGVFDEGCMGMYNAIVPDELLHPLGLFKERLSQSALYAAMREVPLPEAESALAWLEKRGLKFAFGSDPAQHLTREQVLTQLQMYIATLRLADDFGCATVGIQYQQGLKDLTPASDLVEGLLNNSERPPVRSADGKRTLFDREALPHFNEVDECAGIDGLLTYQLWRRLGFPPENTLHDLRYGQQFKNSSLDAYVWVLLISGAAPPAHFIDGYRGASSERQPPMYFRLGGGTLKGISRPGHIVWSRVFVENNRLHCDLGLAEVVELPAAETERRWKLTTPQWPIMHAVLRGVTRDQMMGRHKSNHIQVVYAPNFQAACRGLRVKAAALQELGIECHVCGVSADVS